VHLYARKALLRFIAATAVVAVFGLHQADAATWPDSLSCPQGGGASAYFRGSVPIGTTGQATYTWSLCATGHGCGTQVDSQREGSGTQFYSDGFFPPSLSYITGIGISFNGSFVNGNPDASCG